MTDQSINTDELALPVKRTEGETIEDRLTANAYHNILPARYLRKDANGDLIESQEDLFTRVAKNIALAEAVYEAEQQDRKVTVDPSQLKPDHPRRDELAAEVFGAGATTESDTSTVLSEYNVNKFAYDTVVPELPSSIRQSVEEQRETFENLMENLSFVPNSPTLMNAGDELQQLSACFVDSPADDIDDIHQTAKEAASVFQSGGGMGYAFWQLRPYGDAVGSTGGIASGPITFMRTYDQLCETIAQGGARRGAQMAVMRVSHPDVIQFIHAKNKDVSLAHTLRLNDPDDFTHTKFADALDEARELIDKEGRVPKHLRNAVEGHLSNFNISVGVTNDFMEALFDGDEFTFTNPRTEEPHIATPQTKELYDMFDLGEYVEVGEVLSLPAQVLWNHMINGAHENGEPGVIYLERVNEQHSFDVEQHPDHRILATNPCLHGDMQVAVADGRESVAIKELARESHETPVYTLDESGDLTIRDASAFRTSRDAQIVEIHTDGNTTLKVTPDHEVRTRNRGWVEAESLDNGDSLEILTTYETLSDAESQQKDRWLNAGDRINRLEHHLTESRPDINSPVRESHEVPEAAPQQTLSTVTENHEVTEVSVADSADVYDLSVPETHNFYAGVNVREDCKARRDVFVNVHNCGEQPLEEYEACNLGHINLSTLVAEDAPDWRVWYDEHGYSYDEFDEAVTDFLDEAVDWAEFNHRIEFGTRFLENVVTMSDFPVPEIETKVREMRKIGLGVMGLAQMYIQLGIQYGTEAGNEVARQIMMHINHASKTTSHNLAKERGTFADWEDSKFATPSEYTDWFEHHTGEPANEWTDGYPIRNHNTTTVAPTGTTSMVGNTTGGIEPIYNVAYYKNVSDDVQGDEMLVEFDDYFLRTLRENDIDVETVKREAQEQMAANEFDGVTSLSTVPDAIAELFVVTGDLSGKQHAAVQCATQRGVDSAISKTCNFPNSASKEDMDEVYRYIYRNGGKGVTVYRDGTRSKQVLTTRAQNTEFADEAEAAETLVEQIEDVFGGIDGFFENEAVQAAVDEEMDAIFAATDGERELGQKQPRPDVLYGVTQRIDTGYGKVYVNINEDGNNQPFELFANIGNSGGFTASFTEALAKTISTALRSGVDPREIASELQGIRSPKVAWDKGEQINSIPDAIGTAMRRYLDGDINEEYPQQQNLTEVTDTHESPASIDPETDGGATVSTTDDVSSERTAATDDIIDAGESPECPECGSMSLYFSEGCKTCESCGWSEC